MLETVRMHIPEDLRMNDDEFFRFCQDNPDLKFERRKNGDIIVMGQTGSETGANNSEINADFVLWNRKVKFGKVFDSSAAFRLPDGSVMSPDVSVMSMERWERLTATQRKKFAPVCPDFALELRSQSDRLKDCFEKMDDWMANGCRLAWLIDLDEQKTYVYRPAQEREEVAGTPVLSGEDVLPGFALDLNLLVQ